MSADNDGDSQMLSSPSDSDGPSTPTTQQLPPSSHPASSALSPPDSQHRTTTTISTTAMANANGKRPLNTISNGLDDEDDDSIDLKIASGKARAEFPPKTHERSGYTWSRAEDEPGYAWLNKKAVDEYHRAWDGLVHREAMVKGRYGDPFETADKERAMINSLKQK